ncbi:MAG TPA: polysaccharide deacetylase family protein [Pyrinomonadaceae bacterium]|jgi:peptidoglycan/xylan/chitin deacetylase (PgdA/CDA1 family)|nr:polysaccharide deacetylase family protein [Pyrinomonadaceae bacterium]
MKKLLFALLKGAGAARFSAWLNRRRVVVLCYHCVTPRPDLVGDDPHKQHLPLELFLAHLDHLQSHYRVISLAEFIAARRARRRLPDYSAVLTFDDGMRNFLTLAAPALAARSLHATAFVVTEEAEAAEALPARAAAWSPEDEYAYLSWSEIRELARGGGVEFGSHSRTHPRLTEQPPPEVERELGGSYDALASLLGRRDIPFAYPHGRASAHLIGRVREHGYSCALTTDEGLNDHDTDEFALRRLAVPADDDLATFAARVSGLTLRLRELRRAALSPFAHAPRAAEAQRKGLPLVRRAASLLRSAAAAERE